LNSLPNKSVNTAPSTVWAPSQKCHFSDKSSKSRVFNSGLWPQSALGTKTDQSLLRSISL